MTEPVKRDNCLYAGTFQNFDGSNYSLAGIEEKFKFDGASVSAFVGCGTNFKDNNLDLVVDFKGSANYDKKGILNQNIRLRGKLQENKQSFQVRYSPLSVNVPVGKNTSLYVNPHYLGQIGNDGKWKNSAGLFWGVTQKFGDVSVSAEVQRYNLQKINNNSGANWGGNLTISIDI